MKDSSKKIKILLAATGGGHLSEGLALFGELPGIDMSILSESSQRFGSLSCRCYHFRWTGGLPGFCFFCFMKSLYVILKERPDWVVSTGAETGVLAIVAAKLLFRKTIFVESAGRVGSPSASAKICYSLADRFYVQREDSLKLFGDKAEYMGGIL